MKTGNNQSYIRIVNSKSEEDLVKQPSQEIISSEDVYGNSSYYQHRYGDGSIPDTQTLNSNRYEGLRTQKRKRLTATLQT